MTAPKKAPAKDAAAPAEPRTLGHDDPLANNKVELGHPGRSRTANGSKKHIVHFTRTAGYTLLCTENPAVRDFPGYFKNATCSDCRAAYRSGKR